MEASSPAAVLTGLDTGPQPPQALVSLEGPTSPPPLLDPGLSGGFPRPHPGPGLSGRVWSPVREDARVRSDQGSVQRGSERVGTVLRKQGPEHLPEHGLPQG